MPIDKKVGLGAGSSPLPRGLVHLQRLTLAFVAIVAVGAVFRLVRVNSLGGNFWITGDWLIRYADGYVRRGLLGELAWYLALPPGIDLLWAVTALQVMSFTAFAVFSFLLYLKNPPHLAAMLLFVSPAFLAFHFWDFQGSFRKEIFALAIFAGLLWWTTKSFIRPIHKTLFLTAWSISPALLGFIHEAMVFYAPLMLIALWLAGRSLGFSDKSLWVVSALGAIFAALPVALSLIRPGGQKDQEAICESVMSVGIEARLCNGAIAAIGWTFEDAIQVVSDYSTPLYILLAVLALAPLALVRARKGIFMSVAFALSALVPIFIVGADWGRWIHIAVAILTLTYFRCANARLLVWPPERLPTTVMALFAGTYALGWQMPHFAAAYWGPGVFSVGRSVLRTLGWL